MEAVNDEEGHHLGAETHSGTANYAFPSRGWLWLALVLALSSLYIAHELKRGLVLWDEGVLAESAEQVLHGELPHRDYHELYTGLLSYLNALSFRVWGTKLASMRYMLFLFCVAWVAATFYTASRFVSPPFASAVTLLAVAWGPPNYAAAMPSWYNLFFATFGVTALLRYVEVQSKRWLFVAGVCGGISFLFKMTGLYFVAGALLFLAFREQLIRDNKPTGGNEIVWYRVFVALSVFTYEVLLLALLRRQANVATYVCFWFPNLAMGAAIIWCEFYAGGNRTRRFSYLFRELVPFVAGIAFSVAVFLTPYLLSGSLSLFLSDLMVQPRQMLLSGIKPDVHRLIVGSVVNLVFIAVILLTRSQTKPQLWEQLLLGMPMVLLIPCSLLLAHQLRGFYQMVWSTIWVLAPLVLLLGVGLLARRAMLNRLDFVQSQRSFIVLSVTAACSLIQFPYSGSIYFCYIAPLIVLCAAAVATLMDHPPRLALIGITSFCFLFAVLEMTPGFVFHLGSEYQPDTQTVRLSMPRAGGLRVSAETARDYEALGRLIRQHARGDYILAAANCPEVYFLYGLHSPTKDFLGFSSDLGPRGASDVLSALQSHDVTLLVLNHVDYMFVQPLPNDVYLALQRAFPEHARIESFEVRWKQ